MLIGSALSPENISLVISAVMLVAAVIAAVIVLSKTKGNQQTLTFLSDGNEALRKVNEDQQAQIIAQDKKFTAQLHEQDLAHAKALSDQDRECSAQIGILTGKMEILTGTFGKEIAATIVKEVREAL